MTRFIANNKTELIKLVKIVMIKNKFINNKDIDYDIIKNIYKDKNIDLLFKNGFKVYIEDNN